MKISTVLATKGAEVATIRPEQSIREAVRLLRRHNVGALVVVDQLEKPVGVISERDIVRELEVTEGILDKPVRSVVSRGVVTGSPEDDLHSVMRTMTEKRFRHLPIMEEGKLAGIVSIEDVVEAQLEEYQGEIDTLETRVTGG